MGASVPPLLNWLPYDIGVKVLFLVSGYLISMSYLRKRSHVEYLVKRVSRLYPALIAYLLLAVGVFCFFTTEPTVYWASAKQYFLNNLALSAFLWYYQTYMAGTVYAVWGTDLYSVVPLLLWFLVGCAYYVLDLKKYCNLLGAG